MTGLEPTWCDDWVHLKCTNLTHSEFVEHCNDVNKPFYCEICLFGSTQSTLNQTCLTASEISSLDSRDILDLCPNSIFKDREDILTTEYYTTEELNIEIKKTPENIRLIHINANTHCKHVDAITSMISELSKLPSIIFISETRVHDDKLEFQKTQIPIPGYTFVLLQN